MVRWLGGHHHILADQRGFQPYSHKLLPVLETSPEMKGRQQEGIPEPTTTQQNSSAIEASGDLVASIPGECQPLETRNTARKSQNKMQPSKQKPICRFYVSSSCKYGDSCRFYHPKRSPQSHSNPASKPGENNEKRPTSSVAASRRTPSDLNLGMFMKPVKLRPPVRRPEPVNKTPADLLQVNVHVYVCMCMCSWCGLRHIYVPHGWSTVPVM